MSSDVITEDSIKDLVDRFYAKVHNDSQLGPVFNRAIGENDQDWEPHLERMYAFWSSVMLTSGRYHGNTHCENDLHDRSCCAVFLEIW